MSPGTERPQRSGSSLQPFLSRQRWPVTLRHGPISLQPMRYRDQAEWERVRRLNHAWLRPWEATLPSGSRTSPTSYAGLVRSLRQQAKEGRMLPWLIFYEPAPTSGRSRNGSGGLAPSTIASIRVRTLPSAFGWL